MTSDTGSSCGNPHETRGAALSLDTVFEVLADRRRRFLLYTIVETTNGVADLDELVRKTAAMEAETGDADSPDSVSREIRTDLYHWHLPVLADLGIIDYDDRTETVRYNHAPTLEDWIERAQEYERE